MFLFLRQYFVDFYVKGVRNVEITPLLHISLYELPSQGHKYS
jgi:hypothetical protein